MGRVFKQRLLAATLTAILVAVTLSPSVDVQAQAIPSSDLNIGPYIDRIVYNIIASESDRVLALQDEEAQFSIHPFSDFVYHLESNADITTANTHRNGYGHITINCNKYPFNISAFRRAFAYAYDKTRVVEELEDQVDIVSRVHDSVVPYANGWCIEDDLPYHYYDAQIQTGREILDDAGFVVDGSGFRLAPDGSSFSVNVQYTNMTPWARVGRIVTEAAVTALSAIGVNATSTVGWPHLDNLTEWIDNHQGFDMVYYAYNFPDTDLDWLGFHFYGELAGVPGVNPCNFRNASYDSYRTKLLQGPTHRDVYRAAAAMQRILHENVPLLVVYEDIYTQAFRNDRFTGHVTDPLLGILNPYNLRNMQQSDGYSGGTVPISINSDPNTFNIYLSANDVASQIMSQLWPSLYLKGSDHSPIPHLATDMERETFYNRSSIPQYHTRYTIDIAQNAVWSDDRPITAEDVVYSLIYAKRSGAFGNPAGQSLAQLSDAYAPTPFRVVIEFKSDSYWHFSHFAYDYVIPKHIFENIGFDRWNLWDPVFNATHPFVTAGPFEYEDDERGEFYSFSTNTDYWHYPGNQTPSGTQGFDLTTILAAGGSAVVVAIIVIGIVAIKKGLITIPASWKFWEKKSA
ncbi:MAG: ABC transporter substrate-binding protein [Candidatus Thorarchaeota archaeon]|jgi:ABC-type transport system substrate-binding protein